MPLNKSAYLRYRIIDQCLTNRLHRYPDKEFIQSKIEEAIGKISLSSLEKDFGKMRELFDAPIQYDRNRGGYHYTEEGFSIKEFPLTEEEIGALDFSTAVLQALKETPLFNRFEAAIEKVISGYRVGKILGKTDEELIQVESPLGNSGAQWIEAFYRAIVEHHTLVVRYQSFGGDAREYILCPYLLKEYRNRWYVAAWSMRAGKTLVFGLDRVLEIDRPDTDEHAGYSLKWHEDPAFHPAEFFRYSFGITQLHEANPETVVLSFQPREAAYILSQPLHHSQQVVEQNDSEIRVNLQLYITRELVMTILSYGAGVKVIAPASLAAEIDKEIAAMKKRYES